MNVIGTVVRKVAKGTGWSQQAIGGLLILLLFFGFMFALYNKERITNAASAIFTDTMLVEADFPQDYKLRDHKSDVKVGGVIVGATVNGEPSESGGWRVTMQVDGDLRNKLGSAPSASIRPTLLLGGNYYVDLQPGGSGNYDGTPIPVDRTTLPVELDQVLAAVGTEEAKIGIRSSVQQLGGVLESGGSTAIQDLLNNAPATLDPAAAVLDSARGVRPHRDLSDLVVGLHATASVLTERSGQLEEIVTSLQANTATLADGSEPLARSISTMPQTLEVTRAGLADLRPTLEMLTATADDFRPSARALNELLSDLDPTLVPTRHLLDDLRPLLDDARPLFEQLTPTTTKATRVLGDLEGPVIDRLEGPISDAVLSPWRGTGRYEGGGASGNPLYVELGYLTSRGADGLGWNDGAGGYSRLAAGAAPNSFGGVGDFLSLPRYLEMVGVLPAHSGQHDNRDGVANDSGE